jgi:DNA-binding NarL/FixJ family response regulator
MFWGPSSRIQFSSRGRVQRIMKRVFILSKQSMFGVGIEALLSQEEGLKIVSRDTELSASLECIQKTDPDVVIINCDDPDPELKSIVMDILRERLGICIIGLSLQNNQISIYHGEKKDVRQVEDLLKAIRD